MGPNFLTGVLLIGLFIVAFSLVGWLSRHHRATGSIQDPKAAFVMAVLSFVFVGFGMLASTLPPSGKLVRPDGKELPPDIFAIAPAAVFFCTALLVTIGLLIGAAFQLVSSWRNPSVGALRQNAARLAVYAVGAFLVAIAHLTLLRSWPGLLK
jgi:hypothetical protein